MKAFGSSELYPGVSLAQTRVDAGASDAMGVHHTTGRLQGPMHSNSVDQTVDTMDANYASYEHGCYLRDENMKRMHALNYPAPITTPAGSMAVQWPHLFPGGAIPTNGYPTAALLHMKHQIDALSYPAPITTPVGSMAVQLPHLFPGGALPTNGYHTAALLSMKNQIDAALMIRMLMNHVNVDNELSQIQCP